jgi:hypothetical protein
MARSRQPELNSTTMPPRLKTVQVSTNRDRIERKLRTGWQ